MVRFLKSTCDDFETSDEMERYLFTEKVLALAHIVESACLALAMLAEAGVSPYAKAYVWHLFLAASLSLVFSSTRDAIYSVRHFFAAQTSSGRAATRSENGKLEGSVGGQIHMFSAVTMAVGSLSLLNASIIAMLTNGDSAIESCRRQLSLGFALHFVGAAGNNLAINCSLHYAQNTRVLLTFQHVIGSAALFLTSLLMLPSLDYSTENVVHKTIVTVSASLGAILAVFSAVMFYFHSVAYSWLQREFFDRKLYEGRLTEEAVIQARKQSELEKRGYLRRLRDAIVWRKEATRNRDEDACKERGSRNELEALIEDSSYHQDTDAPTITPEYSLSNASSWSGDEVGGLHVRNRFENIDS